jgi:hypothetical protein
VAALLLAPPVPATHGPPELTPARPALSGDGATVYFTTTSQLVPEDTDSMTDAYARSAAGDVLVSTGSSGGNGPFPVERLFLSGFGNAVFFATREALVVEDTDANARDVYQRDGNVTRLITTGPNGSALPFMEPASRPVVVSGDGTRAFFVTEEKLLASDTDALVDIYRREGGTTTLITPGTSQWVDLERVSTDGIHVVFESPERLAPEDRDGATDVYENDAGTLRLVSQGPTGGTANSQANFLGATPDGTHVYFATAESLVTQDGDTDADIYERAGGTTTFISTSGNNNVVPGQGFDFEAVSEDGSRVIFISRGTYTADDESADFDVFEHSGGVTRLLSKPPGASCSPTTSCRDSPRAYATPDGSHVYFETSEALVAADTNPCLDLYEWTEEGGLRLIGDRAEACLFHETHFHGASEDGSRVIFSTGARLVPEDTDNCTDDWDGGTTAPYSCNDVYEDQNGAITLLSSPNAGGPYHAQFGQATRNGLAVTFTLSEEFVGPPYHYVTRVPSTGYPRPRSAASFDMSLVPAAKACLAPNREHGPPLAYGSCSPPVPESPNLTLGTGGTGKSEGRVRLDVIAGVPGGADDADVRLGFVLTNVMNLPSLSDYTGELRAGANVRLTDRVSSVRSTTDFTFGFTVPCDATADTSLGGECRLVTTMDALVPGTAAEGTRAVWGLDQFRVLDAGSDGNADTAGDNSLLAVSGIFVP